MQFSAQKKSLKITLNFCDRRMTKLPIYIVFSLHSDSNILRFFAFLYVVTGSRQNEFTARDLSISSRQGGYYDTFSICSEEVVKDYFKLLRKKDDKVANVHSISLHSYSITLFLELNIRYPQQLLI